MTPEDHRDKSIREFCRRCSRRNDCAGVFCVFYEYKDKTDNYPTGDNDDET